MRRPDKRPYRESKALVRVTVRLRGGQMNVVYWANRAVATKY